MTDSQFFEVEVAPYWNVNKSKIVEQKFWALVEVAPYWNVNKEGQGTAGYSSM